MFNPTNIKDLTVRTYTVTKDTSKVPPTNKIVEKPKDNYLKKMKEKYILIRENDRKQALFLIEEYKRMGYKNDYEWNNFILAHNFDSIVLTALGKIKLMFRLSDSYIGNIAATPETAL